MNHLVYDYIPLRDNDGDKQGKRSKDELKVYETLIFTGIKKGQ